MTYRICYNCNTYTDQTTCRTCGNQTEKAEQWNTKQETKQHDKKHKDLEIEY